MAKLLFRQNLSPSTPAAISSVSVAKGAPLTNEEGDYNLSAINAELLTKVAANNSILTGLTKIETVSFASAFTKKYYAAFDGNITPTGIKLFSFTRDADSRNTIFDVNVNLQNETDSIRVKGRIALRSTTGTDVTVKCWTDYESATTASGEIQVYTSASGTITVFCVPSVSFQNASYEVNTYERGEFTSMQFTNSLVTKVVTGLTYVTPIVPKTSPAAILPIISGGTGASTSGVALTNLGGTAIGVGLFTATDTPSATSALGWSSDMQAFIKSANNASARTSLGLSSLATASNVAVNMGGTGATTATAALTNLGLSSDGKSLVTSASYSAMRTALGLGTVALDNVVPIIRGGTGATTAAAGRVALGARATEDNTIDVNGNVTLVSGNIYNIYSGSGLVLTLPAAPTTGSWVSIIDKIGSGNSTINRNGKLLMGLSEDMLLDTRANMMITLYYTTHGWIVSF